MPVIDLEDTQGNDAAILIDISNKRDAMSYFNGGTEQFRLTKDGFIVTDSGWKKRHIQIGLGDVAADSDAFEYPLFRLPFDVTLKNAEIGTDTTAASNGTNNQSMGLFKSSTSTAIATAVTNSSTAFTLHVPRAYTGVSTDTIKAGDTVYLAPTKTGSGTALSGVTIALTIEIDIPEAQSGTATDNFMRIGNGEAGADGMIESDHLMRDHLQIKRNGQDVFRIDVDGIMYPGATYTPPDMFYIHTVNVGDVVEADGGAKKSPIFKPNGTVKIEKIFYGSNSTLAADDDTNYTQIIIKDDSGNILTDAFANGPTTEAGLTAGRMLDMGAINQLYATIASTEHLQAEYVT
ncbi:hypothetical protein LCGC14_2162710, partial [marine sediment metagenome]